MELKDIYDEFAQTYDGNRGLFDISHILHAFHTRLPIQKGNLLDLGCGAGEPVARYFLDRGWRVTGVDFSREMLALAARYAPEMDAILNDISQVSFSPQSFEAITGVYSLFHLSRDKQERLFRDIYQWLKPGGKLMFTYATEQYTGQAEFEGYKEFLGKQLFYSHGTPAYLRDSMSAAGFHLESMDYHLIGDENFLWVTATRN